jgi:hypothetical protein
MQAPGEWDNFNVREFLAGIDRHTLAVEVLVAHAIGVVVASVGIAATGKAILRVSSTASSGLADVILVVLARVRGESIGVCVRLPGILSVPGAIRLQGRSNSPNVDLGAAAAVGTNSGIRIVAGGPPAFHVAFASDKLEVTSALRVTVLRVVD